MRTELQTIWPLRTLRGRPHTTRKTIEIYRSTKSMTCPPICVNDSTPPSCPMQEGLLNVHPLPFPLTTAPCPSLRRFCFCRKGGIPQPTQHFDLVALPAA